MIVIDTVFGTSSISNSSDIIIDAANNTSNRPLIVIIEEDDGSVSLYSKENMTFLAGFDNVQSMIAGLADILEKLPYWNLTNK